MADEADKEVEVVEAEQLDPAAQDGGEEQQQSAEQTPATENDDPAAGIAALKTQIAAYEKRQKDSEKALEDERRAREIDRRAREDAERRAGRAQTDFVETQRRAQEAQYNSVVNALAAAQGQLSHAQAQYKQAFADQDAEKAAELAAEIGKISARLSTLEAGKVDLEEQRRENRDAGGRVEQPEDEASTRETWINKLPPRSAAWIRNNYDRYFGDSSFQLLVASAHNEAQARRVPIDSDEYFRLIEERTGMRQPERETEPAVETRVVETPAAPAKPAPVSAAAQTQSRRSPTPSAPAAAATTQSAREPGSSQGGVRLTQQEREFCRLNDIDESAYARQKAELIKEGRIGPQSIH